MKKNKFYYFKKSLILIVPIAVFTTMKGLFEIDYTNTSEIFKLLGKGIFVGTLTSIILGLINMYAKVEYIKKQ